MQRPANSTALQSIPACHKSRSVKRLVDAALLSKVAASRPVAEHLTLDNPWPTTPFVSNWAVGTSIPQLAPLRTSRKHREHSVRLCSCHPLRNLRNLWLLCVFFSSASSTPKCSQGPLLLSGCYFNELKSEGFCLLSEFLLTALVVPGLLLSEDGLIVGLAGRDQVEEDARQLVCCCCCDGLGGT